MDSAFFNHATRRLEYAMKQPKSAMTLPSHLQNKAQNKWIIISENVPDFKKLQSRRWAANLWFSRHNENANSVVGSKQFDPHLWDNIKICYVSVGLHQTWPFKMSKLLSESWGSWLYLFLRSVFDNINVADDLTPIDKCDAMWRYKLTQNQFICSCLNKR